MEPWIYPVVLFPVFFVGLWSGVTWLMSRLSGWASLADSYLAGSTQAELTITGSALLNHLGFPVSYSGVLYVGDSEAHRIRMLMTVQDARVGGGSRP